MVTGMYMTLILHGSDRMQVKLDMFNVDEYFIVQYMICYASCEYTKRYTIA